MKTDNHDIESCDEIVTRLTAAAENQDQDPGHGKWLSKRFPDDAFLPTSATKPIQVEKIYRYEGYSTRSDKRGKGRLILSFSDTETGEVIPAFFNINIDYQRGPMAGQNFKIGRNGRFWVYPGSKFASFWLDAVGVTDKWSRVYRQMTRLKPVRFSGDVQRSETYHQITHLMRVQE